MFDHDCEKTLGWILTQFCTTLLFPLPFFYFSLLAAQCNWLWPLLHHNVVTTQCNLWLQRCRWFSKNVFGLLSLRNQSKLSSCVSNEHMFINNLNVELINKCVCPPTLMDHFELLLYCLTGLKLWVQCLKFLLIITRHKRKHLRKKNSLWVKK